MKSDTDSCSLWENQMVTKKKKKHTTLLTNQIMFRLLSMTWCLQAAIMHLWREVINTFIPSVIMFLTIIVSHDIFYWWCLCFMGFQDFFFCIFGELSCFQCLTGEEIINECSQEFKLQLRANHWCSFYFLIHVPSKLSFGKKSNKVLKSQSDLIYRFIAFFLMYIK